MTSPKNRILAAYVSAFIALGVAAPVHAETWRIDTDHTEVRFTWDHLGMSRQGGRFRDVTGTVTFDTSDLASSSVEVSIPVAGLSTGVAKLDEHLVKTKEFFDVEAHPVITFKSTVVTPRSDRTMDVAGDLTINGITHAVKLDVIWNFTGDHPLASINPTYAAHYSSGFSATTQIRRSDWGIKRTIPYVSDEIRITIETEMHRVGPPPIDADGVAGAASSGDQAGSGAAPAPAPDPSGADRGLGNETVDKAP